MGTGKARWVGKATAILAVSIAFLIGGAAMGGCKSAGRSDEAYVPETALAGGQARGVQLATTATRVNTDKIYIPRSLAPGERARAWYQYKRDQYADSPIFRDFAERSKIVIGPELRTRRELVRQQLGQRLGRPELEKMPVIWKGHSATGRPAMRKALDPANIDRSLAVIGHHAFTFSTVTVRRRRATAGNVPGPVSELKPDVKEGDPRGEVPVTRRRRRRTTPKVPPPMIELKPDVKEGDPRGEVPVWNVVGARDKHQAITARALQASAKVSALGWKWTCVLGHGESHQANEFEALKLLTMWLEDVADLRIRDAIPPDGNVPLHDIDETKTWVGYLELLPPKWGDNGLSWWRVADVAACPYADAPGKGVVEFTDGRFGGYVWLPSERFARAWVDYHRTASVTGDKTTRIQTGWWPALHDTTGEELELGWNLFTKDRSHAFFSILNLPDFKGDFENVKWDVLGSLPEGLVIHPDGQLETKSIKEGTYKLRLRATYGGRSWEGDCFFGLRGSRDDMALKFTVESPQENAEVTLPLQVKWTSTLPLGLLQWHSSIDGDLGTEYGDLGTSGAVDLQKLSKGTHLITLLVYSAAPTTRRQAVSFLLTVTDGGQ